MPNDFDPYYQWLGIPPNQQPPNYYRLLGIGLFETDQQVINNAASQRYLHVQSFQGGENKALVPRILKEIIVAGVCLLTPEKKAKYDAELKSQNQSAQVEPDIPPAMPIVFCESLKTSQIVKSQAGNKYSQIWSASVGVLMLAGLIVTVLAIHKNFQNMTDSDSKGQIDKRSVTPPPGDSRPGRRSATKCQSL